MSMAVLYADKDKDGNVPLLIISFGDRVDIELRHYYEGQNRATAYHLVNRQQVKMICDGLSRWLNEDMESD